MKRRMFTFFPFFASPILVMLLVALSAFVRTPAAHAAPCTPYPRATICYYITNVLNGGNEYDPVHSIIIGPGTGANVTYTWTAGNSGGAQVGISGDVVSAGLSFSVDTSTSVSYACNANTNTTGQDQTLEWDSVFIDWYYDIHKYDSTSGQDTYAGTGWAKEYLEPRCALY